MNTTNTHSLVPFRVQRSLFVFIVFGLLGLYTLSVQWSHVDQISGISADYIPLVKVGLASVEVIVCLLLIWELWSRSKTLSLACFGTVILLEIICVVHAGAILQLDTNRADTRKESAANVDAQIRMAAEIEKARVGATADAAAKLNSMGQTRTARRMVGAASSAPAPTVTVPETESPAQHQSFLPAWYLNGAQYFVTILLAYVGFAFCLFVSRSAVEVEELHGATSGNPEAGGKSATSGKPAIPVVATSMTFPGVTRAPMGFSTSTAQAEPADPKELPRK